MLGAGGPVGAVLAETLEPRYTMRYADVATIEDVLTREHLPGWPRWTAPPISPHAWVHVDVTDYDSVFSAIAGCDAVVNLAVNRDRPDLAFRINVIGAYNIMKAAVAHGAKRVIHTGPVCRVNGYEGDVRYEYRIPDGIHQRPGTHLYAHTKHLSLLVADGFAERHGLDVITLLVSRLRPHDALDGRDDDVLMSFSIAWEDLGEPFLRALQVAPLPNPHEVFHICAPLAMDKWRPEKVKRLLGWEAKHRFEQFCRRPEFRPRS